MPKKRTIAVDIDDVLAANAQGFVDFSNERWGTRLTVDDYDEHWGKMWKMEDEEEVERRAVEYHRSGVIGRLAHLREAKPVLEQLTKQYRLIIVTSRRVMVTEETISWINKHFNGIFSDIRFAGFYDTSLEWRLTKQLHLEPITPIATEECHSCRRLASSSGILRWTKK